MTTRRPIAPATGHFQPLDSIVYGNITSAHVRAGQMVTVYLYTDATPRRVNISVSDEGAPSITIDDREVPLDV